MTNQPDYDVVIVGGGLSGLSLACLLGKSENLKIACLDREDPQAQIRNDERTTAISYGSSLILDHAGVWQNLEPHACPIEDIEILDSGSPVLLQFLSSEVEGKSFGWILHNADIRRALLAKIKDLPNVKHIAPAQVKDFVGPDNTDGHNVKVILADEFTLSAKLVVGADGRGSFVRQWLDIPVRQWSYNQAAVICMVEHENPHNNNAVEHFWPAGPFAVLPMVDDAEGNHKSSLVFTEHGPKRKSMMNLSDEEFLQAVREKFPPEYGRIKIKGPRQRYPLGLIHATRYIGPRMALVADAAHGIHPIAGQGLNLGFRDLGELGHLIEEAAQNGQDPGAQELLETYQRRRRPDNTAMIAVTDGFVKLFSNNLPPLRILRRIGLKAVANLPPAKRFFMRHAMGE